MTRRVIIGVFTTEDDIIRATRAAERGGLEIVDVYTPYAVHGLDRAMGLAPSQLPWVTFLLGLFGAVSMTAFQYWASAVSWPINVGGKPWNSLPAFIPVIFEVTVLLGGLGTVGAFIWWAGLRPGGHSPLADLRVTDDRFALVLAAGGPLDRAGVEALFSKFHLVGLDERDIEIRKVA
jgi:ActD protein